MSNFEPAGGRHEVSTVPLAGPPDPGGPSPLRSYAGTLRRRWRWVALGALVGLLAGIAAAVLQKDVRDPTTYYKATTTLVARGAASAAGEGTTAPGPDVTGAAIFIDAEDVVTSVAGAVGVPPAEVDDLVSAVAQSNPPTIDVIAISTDAEQATTLADTAADVLIGYVSTDQQNDAAARQTALTDERAQLEAQLADLQGQLAADPQNPDLPAQIAQVEGQIEANSTEQLALQTTPIGSLTTLGPASAVQINGTAYNQRLQANREGRGAAAFESSSGTGTLAGETDLGQSTPVGRGARVLIGLGSGLLLGLISAFVVEAWDDRIRRSERAEGVTGFPVIAEVPQLTKSERESSLVPALDSPGSRVSERYRSIRTSLLFLLHQPADGHPEPGSPKSRTPVILVTSPNPSEGKTTTVANIAASFGDNGARTLVVDGDYRKPAIARFLQPTPELDRLDQPARTRLPNVWFVPSPRTASRAGQIVQSIRAVVERWRDEYDIVLLDTPPMLTTNDAIDLLPAADSLLLVLRAGQSRVGQAERAANLLRRFDVNVLGLVLNGCSDRDTDDAYGYGYDYELVPPADQPAPTNPLDDLISGFAPAPARPADDALLLPRPTPERVEPVAPVERAEPPARATSPPIQSVNGTTPSPRRDPEPTPIELAPEMPRRAEVPVRATEPDADQSANGNGEHPAPEGSPSAVLAQLLGIEPIRGAHPTGNGTNGAAGPDTPAE